MKTNFFFVVFIVFVLSLNSCTKENLNINNLGEVVTVEKNYTNYSELDISDDFDVFVRFSDTEESIEIEANKGLQDRILIIQNNENLKFKFKNNTNISGDFICNVFITTKHIKDWDASGHCTFTVEDPLVGNHIEIDLSGHSQFKANMDVETANIDLSGTSLIELTGQSKQAHIDLAGNSKVVDYDFSTQQLTADLSGNSEVKMTITESITADLSGTSKILYKGDATITAQDLSGTSEIRKVN